jgi:hypothetical protein
MHIDTIDTILYNVLDDFYTNIVAKKTIDDIIHTVNFVEKQEKLMDIVTKYIKSIDFKDLRNIINDNQHINHILNIFHKFIYYYVFIVIGYFYENKIDTYKNNMIEISKIYDRKKYSINYFFIGETNSNVFLLVDMVRNLRDIFLSDKQKQKKSDQSFEETLKFLETQDATVIDKFKQLLRQQDKLVQSHNIIKLVLCQKIYLKYDKNEIAKILEVETISSGESIYIDVVMPIERNVDLIDIEAMLTPEEIERGVAINIYDIINTSEISYQSRVQTTEMKLFKLLQNKCIVPITEDFMLYHKSSEKYDVRQNEQSKTKQDTTRLKYILDKIQSTEKYYGVKNDKSIDKNFYVPLVHRRAILYNEVEDIKIINKLLKYGANEYFGDLLHYRKYPYINFKDFKKNGFAHVFDTTHTALRSASFEHQQSSNLVQTRTCSKGQHVNIVGLMFNTHKYLLNCEHANKLIHNVNTHDKFASEINNKIMNNSAGIITWMFDLELDKSTINTYEQFGNLDQMEKCKILCAKLCDDIIDIIFNKIVKILNKQKEISFYDAFRIINRVTSMVMMISENDTKFLELKKIIYNKLYEKCSPQYDKKEDIVYGLYGETLKLPIIPKIAIDTTLRLRVSPSNIIKKQQIEKESGLSDNVICHHFVSWEQIMLRKRTATNKYTDMIREFMQKFILIDDDNNYICKSCSSLLDIKKYVSDGTYDEVAQKFIPFSIPMNVSLEDIPEYKKYNISIRNIDSLINKIADSINIPYLVGPTLTQTIHRTTMVKDTIDLIQLNNTFLFKDIKKRNENATTNYGISRELSNLFAFELDNSIFLFTSGKEKDLYKYKKHNNIVAYILFLILLELDESHIAFLSGDKICNFGLYAKFKDTVFNGLKIISNSSGDLQLITKYPVLCYLIYVATCILSKYQIWYSDAPTVKKKINPAVQKIMVHTLIDLINCILEYASKNRNKHVYEVVYYKFNNKLQTTYISDEIIKRLTYDINKNSANQVKSVNRELIKPTVLSIDYAPSNADYSTYSLGSYVRKYFPVNKLKNLKIEISNLTHCADGTIHTFVLFEKTMKCKKCGITINTNERDDELTETINNNIMLRYYEKICDKYCANGRMHLYVTDTKICRLCGYQLGKYPALSKMKEVDAVKSRHRILKMYENKDEQRDKYETFVNKILTNIKSKYTDSKSHRDDYYKFIETFVNLLQSIVGDTIRLNDKTIYLKENTYIIDHNHLGYPIEPPIIISEHDNNISFKKNNLFFKTDVIVYNTRGNAKIEIYYDMNKYTLLGYKEFNKDYVVNAKTENKIKLEYSIMNKLKYLGSLYVHIPIDKYLSDNIYNDTVKPMSNIHEDQMQNIVGNIIRERIVNLGNIIYKFLVYINLIITRYNQRVKDTHTPKPFQNKDVTEEPHILLDISKYYNKLSGMVTSLDDTKMFKLWYMVVQNIHYKDWKLKRQQPNITNNIMLLDDVHNVDYSGNLLLYYFVSEMTNLCEINKNKYVKQNLAQFITEYINVMFNEYNMEYIETENEVRRFISIINSSEYYNELENMRLNSNEYTTGIYGEYRDPDDVKTKEEIAEDEDDKEAAESVDVDPEDIDDEDDYDRTYSDRPERMGKLSIWEREVYKSI